MDDSWTSFTYAAASAVVVRVALEIGVRYARRLKRGPQLMRVGGRPNWTWQAVHVFSFLIMLLPAWLIITGLRPGSGAGNRSALSLLSMIALVPLGSPTGRFWTIHENGILFSGDGRKPAFVPWEKMGAPEFRDDQVIIHGPAMFNDGTGTHAIEIAWDQRSALEAILATRLHPAR